MGNGILSDGMVMCVDEVFLSFLFSLFLYFSFSLFLIGPNTSVYIIISCFVRENEEKTIVLFLAIGEYALFDFFLSFENRTEKKGKKTQLIGGQYIALKSLPDMFTKGQMKREEQINEWLRWFIVDWFRVNDKNHFFLFNWNDRLRRRRLSESRRKEKKTNHFEWPWWWS